MARDVREASDGDRVRRGHGGGAAQPTQPHVHRGVAGGDAQARILRTDI